MDKMILFEAINMIGDDLVKDASEERIRNAGKDSPVIKTAQGSENDITVSGVETYRSFKWQRFAAVASAVLLTAGIGAGGALMLRHRPPLLNEISEITSSETTSVTEARAGGKGSDGSEKSSSASVTAAETRTEKAEDITMSEEKDTAEKPDADRNEDVTEAPREENDGIVTTAEVSQQWKTSPAVAETRQKPTTVTTADVHYPGEKTTTTEPFNPYAPELHEPGYYRTNYLTWYPEDKDWLFNILENLDYQPYTCDCLPEALICCSNGTTFQFNFSEGYVRRNNREQAPMPDEIRQYFIGIAE